jgi:membrane protein implicated in regulation of membrane protease activity
MQRQFAFRTAHLGPQRPGGWRVWLGLALAGAAAAALLLVFGLVMLILLPVFLVAALVGRWWLGRELKKAAQARGQPPAGVIEGHYEVVEPNVPPPGRGWGPRR